MSCNIKYTWKCLLDGLGVHTYTPTTSSTTIDSIYYLVDCNGNYIVDCECNYIVGGPCGVTTSSSTTSSASTSTSSSTSSSSSSTSTSSSTSSSSTSTSTSSSTSSSSTSTSTSTSTSSTSTIPFSPLPVPLGGNVSAFGDSITLGPPYVTVPQVYASVFASSIGKSVSIYAAGSSGFKTLMKNSNANITPNTNIAIELTGLNNVTGEGSKLQNTPIITHGCLTLLANQWASSIINGASSSITKTGGTFTGYAAARRIPATTNNAFGGKYGITDGQSLPNTTDAVYTNSAGAYIEYTATFKNAIIALVGGNGQFSSLYTTTIPSGIVRIYLDNVLQTTINLGEQYPKPYGSSGDGIGPDFETVGPVMYAINAATNASHTIKVELVSGDMALDYISVLNNTAACYPVVLGEIPYVDPSQWGTGSQLIANSYSNIKASIVNTWASLGFPIRYADTNTYYNYVGNTSDGTHPTPAGHIQIAHAFDVLFM